MPWAFRAYRVGADSDVLEQWYASESKRPKVQAKFDQRMALLAGAAPHEWVRPYSDTLNGDGAGMREIRFEAAGVAWRPIGFFSGTMEFTFLLFATEHNKRFVPHGALITACKRMEEVKSNRDWARDVDIA